MKKIYHLSTCSTCQRIIKELQLPNDFVFQDIKTEIITTAQIEEMRELSQNYEALFSKRAVLYRERNLKEQNLTENDFKALIL
jgi:arsenate reductase-like glutaredoxin family protein